MRVTIGTSGAGLVGDVASLLWAPGVHARSAIQHFAAGVVIAAVASDLIPEVEKIGRPAGILIGFATGGAFMDGNAVRRIPRAAGSKATYSIRN